jgi:hypothetical protein
MLTEEFLSSGPTHGSIIIPSLNSLFNRPSRTSIPYVGGCQFLSITGQPPTDFKRFRIGISPIRLI